jgi:exopolysaccharide production protein ExoZ
MVIVMPTKKKVYHQLQIMRAIAALLVVVDHSLGVAWPHVEQLRYIGWCCGDLGVGIFFVISGFIMVHVSEDEFGRPHAWRRFALRRMERVIPLYWIATSFVVVGATFIARTSHSHETLNAEGILKSYLFIPYMNGEGVFRPLHGVGWTLNYEMFFYFCFAACLLFKRKEVSVLTCSALLTVLVGVGMIYGDRVGGADPANAFEFMSYPIILLFAVGMIVRLIVKDDSRFGGIKYSALVMTFVPLAVILVFATTVGTYPVSLAWRAFLWMGCVLTVVGTLVLEKSHERANRAVLGLEFLGNASYSTYLFHPFALSVTKMICAKIALPNWLIFAMCIAGAHICGGLVHLYVENPLLHAFANRRRFQNFRARQQST